jgi:hypothetical protein
MNANSMRTDPVAGLRRTGLVLLLLLAGSLAPGPVQAADVVTEGNMEDTGTINWPHTNLVDINSSDENATDQVNSPTHSLKGTSATGQRLDVAWHNAQTVGTIGPGDTVTLSLWWGARYNVSSQSGQGDLFVETKPTSGAWGADETTLWTLQLVPSTGFQSNTVINLDVSDAVSGAFPTTESYDLRVRFNGRTGRDNAANVDIWWDDIVLDVTAPGGDDTLTVTQTNVPAADVAQGTTEKLLQVLDLSIDNVGNGTTSVQQLSVTRLGTAVDADTAAGGVELWHDANDNNAWDSGVDVQLDGSQTFSGGTVTFTAIGFTVNNGTPEKLLITVDVAAAGASTEGNTIGTQTTAIVLSDSDTVTGLPLSGNSHTITDSGDQLTAGQTATGGGNVNQGAANQVVQVLDLTVDNDTAELTDLTVTRTGTAQDSDTDASGIKLWHDVNDNNTYDNGTDTQLDGSQTFSAGTVTFTGIGFTVTAGTPEKVLVTYDIAAGAVPGRTIGGQVNTNGGITVASPDTVANTGLLIGDSFTIQAATGDNLSASNNTPIRALDPTVGETGLVMQRLQLDSDTAGDGAIELTSVSVGDLGTAQTADIATVSVYMSTDLDFASGVLVGSETFNVDPKTVPLTGGTVADRTITNPSPKYLWVVYDLAGAAVAGRTIQSRIIDLIVAAPDTDLLGQAFDSNLLTLITATQNDTVVAGSEAFVTQCSLSTSDTGQITAASRFTGDANDDGSVEVRYDTSPAPDAGSPLACATATGPSPRQCLVSGLAAGTYYLRVDFFDGDGVGGATDPQILNNGGSGYTVATCGGDTSAPTVLILSPWRDAIIGGSEKIRVQVYDQGGGLTAADLLWAVDAGTLVNTGVGINGTYDCGTDCSIYEFDLDTTTVNGGLTDDGHRLVIQVTDGASHIARVEQAFQVRNLGATPGGSGQLLRRTPGSRLCVDCHEMATHSSQNTSTKYGNWAMACNDCHTPHGTTNIFLLREEIRTPNSGKRSVRFENRSGAADVTVDLPGQASFANEDAGSAGAPAAVDGPCQVCHTRTQASDGKERWRNFDQPVPNADNHYDFGRPTQQCTNCHGHTGGFSGAGGGDCSGCHFGSGSQAVQAGRRDVQVDFGKRSHHVGNAGAAMGGVLTNFDCVVCHAEGTITNGETATTADYHNDNDCSGSPCIDLKDVDNWDNLNPDTSPVFRYDKQRLIDTLCTDPDLPCDAPETWGSGDADWEDETSTALDPFCLTCHDFDGATASRSEDSATDNCTAADPLNPFCDGMITNDYDQTRRGGRCSTTTTQTCAIDGDCPGGETCEGSRVTDIASRVTRAWRTGPSGAYTATDRDGTSEPRWTESPNCTTTPASPGCGIADPPLGVYSRHAIRGVDLSTIDPSLSGFSGAASVYANAVDPDQPPGLDGIPPNRWTSTTWEDNSVMGCADCHTVDGANHTDGNAHGSNSEYLLKDADGLATQGTRGGGTYNCWRCHSDAWYDYFNTANNHTDNSSDWAETVGLDGTARLANDGNIYGMACTNCHGGAEGGTQGPTPPGPGPIEFGTIHGTSQSYGIGEDGDSGTRLAYRFMNGNSLRYYNPNGWSGNVTVTCYTIDSSEQDSFGGCSQHNKSGKGWDKPVDRDLKY